MIEKSHKNTSIVICSMSCDVLNLLPEGDSIRTITGNYCFSHLTCDEFLDYLISQGSYIISSGWLKKWKSHINDMGFDQATARRFFQESNKQLVFLDAEKDKDDEWLVKELSSYVGLPYKVISVELEGTRLMIRSLVYEWRLHKQEKAKKSAINELRNQCAEYSTIFDMLSKISTYAKRRDVVGQIKELFVMVFGARKFSFWSDESSSLPEEIRKLRTSETSYLLLKEDNRFCIKIAWDGIFFGIIDVSGFLFPQYIEKYLNLAVEVSRISGLVFHNNVQYEKILESEKELKYLSFHDAMTGLFNRAYINRVLLDTVKNSKICVFMFDIDELKYVNDNYGHVEGDKLIKSFAEILKRTFRETDIVARIGGDEFIAVLHDSDEESPKIIKERIIDLIKINNKNIKEEHLKLSASIGCAMPEIGSNTIEDLMKKADIQMYVNKACKCNRI
ncbi:GGDEF domain-containing protein [Alkalibacter saccharofermentans]|nr:GGDEF domain-containing protein [Alkalibacter saccharofermentans]